MKMAELAEVADRHFDIQIEVPLDNELCSHV